MAESTLPRFTAMRWHACMPKAGCPAHLLPHLRPMMSVQAKGGGRQDD